MKKLKIVSFIFSLIGIFLGLLSFWFAFTLPGSWNLELQISDFDITSSHSILQLGGSLLFLITIVLLIMRIAKKNDDLLLKIFNILFISSALIFMIIFFFLEIEPVWTVINNNNYIFSMSAIGMLSIGFIFAVLSSLKITIINKKPEISHDRTKLENSFQTNDDTFNPEVNSESEDIIDRIKKAKKDLIEGNFENTEETEETPHQIQRFITREPTVELQERNITVQEKLERNETIPIPGKVKYGITEEFGPIVHKNPYKEVIVPRRMKDVKFDKPIVSGLKEKETRFREEQSRKNMAHLDDSYRDKLFLGEGDRIWEVVQKQKRPTNKVKGFKNMNSLNASSINNFSNKKNTTIVSSKTVQDPLNEREYTIPNPTIDWDD